MTTAPSRSLDPRTVLLFYREPERDRFVRHDRYLRRALRPVYNVVRRDQKVSGFFVWYRRLQLALGRAGRIPVCNDLKLARAFPEHPVGLVGYPVLLSNWTLPNPAVLGPAMFDHPAQAPHLLDDRRFRRYLVTSEWMHDLFAPLYGDRLGDWYAGIDLDEWPDGRTRRKTLDVLVYDKIRWRRDHYESALLRPVLGSLQARGLTTRLVRYGQYQHHTYRRLLQESRAMLFLCEHETQGMAYQEALASNVPILAWDQGFWLDPNRTRYTELPVPATSVPQWSPACGEKFANGSSFEGALDRFWARLDQYRPRDFVRDALSLEGSARAYLEAYDALLPAGRLTEVR